MPAEERHSAPGAQLSRRSLFAAGAAMAVATTATAAGPASAAELAARYHAEAAALNARDDLTAETEGPAWDRVNAIYEAAGDAPIHTHADAAAKVRLGLAGFQMGERSDGRDVACLEDAARWLEAL